MCSRKMYVPLHMSELAFSLVDQQIALYTCEGSIEEGKLPLQHVSRLESDLNQEKINGKVAY